MGAPGDQKYTQNGCKMAPDAYIAVPWRFSVRACPSGSEKRSALQMHLRRYGFVSVEKPVGVVQDGAKDAPDCARSRRIAPHRAGSRPGWLPNGAENVVENTFENMHRKKHQKSATNEPNVEPE